MFDRRNQVLTGLLVVQIVLAGVLLWPRSNAASGAAGPLFEEARAGNLTSLSIEDDDGKTLRIAKQNGDWVLPEAGDYPADETKVDELAEKIAALKASRVVARSGSSHKQLKVADDDFERRIDFSLSDGSEHTVYIGSTVSSRASHVRAARHNEVYLADDLSSWQASTSVTSWIDAVYFQFERDDVAAMSIQNNQGRFRFVRSEEGNWSMRGVPRGRSFDPDKVTTLINRISSLRLREPLGDEDESSFGLADPSAVVEVTVREAPEPSETEDGEPTEPQEKTITLVIGGEGSDENSYVVKSSESPHIVEVSSWSVEDFVSHTLDDFLTSDDES